MLVLKINNSYYLITTANALTFQNYGSAQNLWDVGSSIHYYIWNGSSYEPVSSVPNVVYSTTQRCLITNNSNYFFTEILFASNYDVKYTTNRSLTFFQTTPVTSLARVLEKEEMGQVLQEIVAILPLILVVVVSFLGLRKALALLSQVLHKA